LSPFSLCAPRRLSSARAVFDVGFRVGCVGFFVGTGLSKAVHPAYADPVFAMVWTVLYFGVLPLEWFLSPLRLPISPSRPFFLIAASIA
jgi:hypothetical protein